MASSLFCAVFCAVFCDFVCVGDGAHGSWEWWQAQHQGGRQGAWTLICLLLGQARTGGLSNASAQKHNTHLACWWACLPFPRPLPLAPSAAPPSPSPAADAGLPAAVRRRCQREHTDSRARALQLQACTDWYAGETAATLSNIAVEHYNRRYPCSAV